MRSVSFSTHRVVGELASVSTALLCVLAAMALKSWVLGVVAFAAFAEMASARTRHKLTLSMARIGCDPAKIHDALLACWARLGRIGDTDGSSGAIRKARVAKGQIQFVRPFLTGEIEMRKMTFRQIGSAIVLYVGLLLLFAAMLVFVLVGGKIGDHLRRGDDHVKSGELDAAAGEYSEAIRLYPGGPRAYVCRGIVYAKKEMYDLAIADCTEAIRLDPKGTYAYFVRAAALLAKGECNRAIADCTEAIQLAPEEEAYYRMRAKALRAVGKEEEAARDDARAQGLKESTESTGP